MIQITFIIPTFNRKHNLKATLDSIIYFESKHNNYEVIVIDNGSTDGTKEVFSYYKDKFSNFHYVYDDNPGLHVGRHKGLENAKGDILVFLDDDIEIFPDHLKTILACFQKDPSIALVGGKDLPLWEEEPPFWLWKMWETPDQSGRHILGHLSLIDLGEEEKYINPYYIFGCNFSIRKSVLKEAGGFHPDGMPQRLIRFRGDGETHVSSFIKKNPTYKAYYHPGASVYHRVPKNRMTYDYFATRSFNEGISNSYASLREKTIAASSHTYGIIEKMKKLLKIASGIEQDRKLNNIQQTIGQTELTKLILQNLQDGFNFHQAWYKKDAKLREWVHRSDYLNDNAKI